VLKVRLQTNFIRAILKYTDSGYWAEIQQNTKSKLFIILKINYCIIFINFKRLYARQFITETSISNIPFSNNVAVKIIIIPKVDLLSMSFPEIWKSTKLFYGNFTDDVALERDER